MQVIIPILSIIVMIIIHEWGHFIAGRLCGAKIGEFSVGMGPLVFQKKGKKETSFSLRALPIGGYCAFEESQNGVLAGPENEDLALFKRMFIFIAGPLMNIISAVFLYFLLMSSIGMSQSIPVVENTVENMPAAGILFEGDEILSVDGKEVGGSSERMLTYIHESGGKEITLAVKNGGNKRNVKIIPVINESTGKYVLGFNQKTKTVRLPILQSAKESVIATWTTITGIFDSIAGLASGRYKASDMSGIVGIVSYAGGLVGLSTISPFIMFMALISVNLGIMNLFPIPGLDGSKILFGFYELIFKRRVPEKIETKLTILGFSLLAMLFVAITLQDVIKML